MVISSRINEKKQTRVPDQILDELNVSKNDLLAYTLNDDGEVLLKKAKVTVDGE